MASKKLRSVDPFTMIVDRLHPLCSVGMTDVPLAVAHDEQTLDAQICRTHFHFAEIDFVGGLIHEELIDVLDREDSMIRRDFREIEIVDLAGLQFTIDCPLSQRNLKCGLLPVCSHRRRTNAQCCGSKSGPGKELSARRA